ncbi:unnamed protein product [Symbiodinium necroappetens]|uniref:Uncharacterized protein n=1 Tax=Symbiodinium necroappetens TaxID=1628268 RepID=A0A812QML1_9DINO|nr:unnamed protein product [Symbiodinium necroappetens]
MGQGADKNRAGRSALIVEGCVELECSGPAVSKDFDSFRHIADLADRQAIEEGRSLPVDRATHTEAALRTRARLRELISDPAKLKRTVKLSRMPKDQYEAVVTGMTLSSMDVQQLR